jgi:hypothetical protein
MYILRVNYDEERNFTIIAFVSGVPALSILEQSLANRHAFHDGMYVAVSKLAKMASLN